MYAVAVFALALLSPLPFVSPFDNIVQDATAQNIPPGAPSFEIIPHLIPSPFGSIMQDPNDPHYIRSPLEVKTFEIGNSIYASISSTGPRGSNIVNITDPSSPKHVFALGSTVTDAEYTVINGSTYAIFLSYSNHSLSIMDVSNPSSPYLVTSITDGANYTLYHPRDVTTMTLDSSTFAIVISAPSFGGSDSIQIIDITDPVNPIAASTIVEGNDNYTQLHNSNYITAVTINSSTFALVTTIRSGDDGIQIIDITDPYNPIAASAITNSEIGLGGHIRLSGIITVTIGSSIFALAAGDGTVQIIDITDPYNPDPVSIITHGDDGYDKLYGSKFITALTFDSTTYALVAAPYVNSVQIIDITDPYNPIPLSAVTDNEGGYTALHHAYHITTVTIDSSTYALVTTFNDMGGVQIIKLDYDYIYTHTSNQNPKYAKAGDTLGISFTTSDTIASHSSQILGLNASATVNGAVYDATVTIPSTPRESHATFTIQAVNTNGESVTITENDVSSNVFIDTISPSIKLVDSANYTIPYGTLNPSIPDVTVSDGDPNYLGGFTLVKNATVDATILGSVYNYTYTANPDTAGNPGSTISRIITVQNPPFEIIPNLIPSPFTAITYNMPGFSSIYGPREIGTFEIGDYTYAPVLSMPGYDIFPDTLVILNITDPSSQSIVSSIDLYHGFKLNGMDRITYAIIDGFTYIVSQSYRDDGVLIINVSNPSLPSLVTFIPNGGNYTELYGPFDIDTVTIGTSTYAVVPSLNDNGVQIINITDPSNPTPASAISGGEDGYTGLNEPVSITTVTIDSSTFALATSSWDQKIQIIDITNPYNPAPASVIPYGPGRNVSHIINDITTVKIDSSTFALMATYDSVVQIMDITDPYNPITASIITDNADYPELGGAHSITTVTIDSSTYALVAAYGDSGVQIIDITDPYNPTPGYAISDNKDGYTTLRGAESITTTTIGSSMYALVASHRNHGIQTIKLDHEYISAHTSNQNPKYAKAGDALEISFTASDAIASQTSQILGLNPNATVNGAVYNAIVPVPSAPRESYATFTIQVTNANSTSVTVTENDISSNDISSNVFIDTISPSIELIDSADYRIPYGILDPLIPNVTVSDGDPNYLGGFTLVKSAPVDTTILGSVYSYTYTADPDGSGNAGNSVTRTISVVDNSSSNTFCMDPESSYNIITGNDSSKVLNGTTGNDLIYGTEGNDVINGLGGNDCIYGNGGDDMIDGGDGHDAIHGGSGHDIIKGGDGDDAIDGESGHDDISGDSGDDALYGGNGKDIINGNAGNDALFGDGNDDTINGNGGNDVITGGSGHDIIAGGPDNDTLYGGNGADTINGNDGNDELFGDGSDDIINGNAGNDVISGGSGNDAINGNDGDDVMVGGLGDDIITGGSGKDVINGSAGDDELFGGGNDDTINGNDGNDLISGGYGHDTLYGEGGDDTINGDGDNDVITGGFGNDVITGGSGHDIIVGTQPDDIVHVASSGASSNYKLRD